METLVEHFGSIVTFLCHSFDGMVQHRIFKILCFEEVVYFFKEMLAQKCIAKQLLAPCPKCRSSWFDSYERDHSIPIEWEEQSVPKEEYVPP